MTICIATDAFYPQIGGIATFYGNLTGLLLERGHRVLILTISHSEADASQEDEIIEERGYTRVTLKRSFYQEYHHYRRYFRPGGYMAPYWIAIGTSLRRWLQQNHRQQGIDVVEVTDYGGIGFFLGGAGLPPVAVTGHGCLAQYAHYNHTGNGEQVRLIQQLEQAAFRDADSIIAHSPLNRKDLETLTGRSVDFTTAPWMQRPREEEVSGGDYFLVVGGMQVVKGSITMAKAVEQAIKTLPDLDLRWIGTDFFVAPGQKPMSQYLARTYPATWNRHFHWLNEQDRGATQKALMGCRAVVVPSDWETFNYVALEAAAAGKPLILSDKAGAEYLFTHEQDALLVAGGDASALARALIRLGQDRSLGQRLGAAARRMIERQFSAQQIVEERLAIFERILSHPKTFSEDFTQRSRFLEAYTTAPRRWYFGARALAKRWIKGR